MESFARRSHIEDIPHVNHFENHNVGFEQMYSLHVISTQLSSFQVHFHPTMRALRTTDSTVVGTLLGWTPFAGLDLLDILGACHIFCV